MKDVVVGFAGLTHLGIISAVASAAKGFKTIGFHLDPHLIADINQGTLPVLEPDLPELFAKHRDHLVFSAEASALNICDIVYVAVDVPTDDYGKSDLTPVSLLIDRAAT